MVLVLQGRETAAGADLKRRQPRLRTRAIRENDWDLRVTIFWPGQALVIGLSLRLTAALLLARAWSMVSPDHRWAGSATSDPRLGNVLIDEGHGLSRLGGRPYETCWCFAVSVSSGAWKESCRHQPDELRDGPLPESPSRRSDRLSRVIRVRDPRRWRDACLSASATAVLERLE